jgi:hypothetical protein
MGHNSKLDVLFAHNVLLCSQPIEGEHQDHQQHVFLAHPANQSLQFRYEFPRKFHNQKIRLAVFSEVLKLIQPGNFFLI